MPTNRATRRHPNPVTSKHRKVRIRVRDSVMLYVFQTTKRLPHDVKRENRRRNKVAHASRMRNAR